MQRPPIVITVQPGGSGLRVVTQDDDHISLQSEAASTEKTPSEPIPYRAVYEDEEGSGGTSHLLPMERAKASFNVETMTTFLDEGVDGTKKRLFITNTHKKMTGHDKHDKGRTAQVSDTLAHFYKIHMPFLETGYRPTRDEMSVMLNNQIYGGGLNAHFGLFCGTIRGQGSADQHRWWYDRAMRMQIVGSYAQTELGHGSNVRGLQTQAMYDPATEEWVLNTPTLQSMKWWPTNLVSSTHWYAPLLFACLPIMIVVQQCAVCAADLQGCGAWRAPIHATAAR
jgi:hypothetical protein